MSGWDDMVLVGEIARPHGTRGQVIVNPSTDFPEHRYQVGAKLWMKGHDAPRELTIRAVRFQHGRPVVAFDGIQSIEDAEALGRGELRVPEAEVGALPEGTYHHYTLIGCRVVTTQGEELGTVQRIEGPMERSLLVIEGGDAEVLVPMVEGICVEINPRERRVVIEPPDGLVTLNRSERGAGRQRVRGPRRASAASKR